MSAENLAICQVTIRQLGSEIANLTPCYIYHSNTDHEANYRQPNPNLAVSIIDRPQPVFQTHANTGNI